MRQKVRTRTYSKLTTSYYFRSSCINTHTHKTKSVFTVMVFTVLFALQWLNLIFDLFWEFERINNICFDKELSVPHLLLVSGCMGWHWMECFCWMEITIWPGLRSAYESLCIHLFGPVLMGFFSSALKLVVILCHFWSVCNKHSSLFRCSFLFVTG